MAETDCRESSVAISSTQPTFWDLVSSSTNNPWQQQTIPNYSNTCNNNNGRCDDHDQDVSNSSASFTNTSNHSSLSVDSSRRLVDHRSASSNDDLMNGEQVSDNHIWNQVLLSSVNGHHGLRNNDHVDIGENFLDSLSAKSLSSSTHHHSLYEPACDYLKKLDSASTAWEFPNSGAASLNLNSFDKQLNGGGFIDDNHMIENDRLTKLSHLVSTWSIAPPEPQLMDHDDHHHHYSQPGLFEAHAHGLRATSFSKNSGISDYHQICLDNAMAADDHYPHQNGKSYFNGNGILPVDSRNIADVLSFTSRLGNYNKPLIDHTAHAPKPNGFKPSTTVSNHLPKKQGIQTSSSSRTSSGRGQGIANEGKKKRTDDNTSSSETVAKKAKQETSTVSSSVKMQAPKVKIGDKITALQQIVSPFGKTDTASVLYEAIQFIKFLQDQVHVLLSNPYLKTNNSHKDPWATSDVRKDHGKGDGKLADLKSKGLCLVPVSCMPQVFRENTGSEYWAPTYRGCLYR